MNTTINLKSLKQLFTAMHRCLNLSKLLPQSLYRQKADSVKDGGFTLIIPNQLIDWSDYMRQFYTYSSYTNRKQLFYSNAQMFKPK